MEYVLEQRDGFGATGGGEVLRVTRGSYDEGALAYYGP